MNVLISGISSGLGYALASEILSRGDNVYGLSRTFPGKESILNGKSTNQDIAGAKYNENLHGQNLHFASIDLSDLQSISSLLKKLIRNVTVFDLVILNAGVLGKIQEMQDTTLEDLNLSMNVNLWANKIILDVLFSSGSLIKQVVAISSGASVSGQKGWNGYAISKAALNMMIMLYAAEKENVHFISLAPGLVQTPMQDIIAKHSEPEKFPVVERLQKARGTKDMLLPETAAKNILNIIPELIKYPSGSFLDIRKLNA